MLLERYNTEARSQHENICLGEPVRTFAANLPNFKPEFWGMLPTAIAAGKPVTGTRDQQHF
jgi:hypothetical protein